MCTQTPAITGPHIPWSKISKIRKKYKYRNFVKSVIYAEKPSEKSICVKFQGSNLSKWLQKCKTINITLWLILRRFNGLRYPWSNLS